MRPADAPRRGSLPLPWPPSSPSICWRPRYLIARPPLPSLLPLASQEAYGLFPPLKGQSGLTPAAEMYNGRMAMMGLIMVVSASMTSGMDILEVVDLGLGGLLSK